MDSLLQAFNRVVITDTAPDRFTWEWEIAHGCPGCQAWSVQHTEVGISPIDADAVFAAETLAWQHLQSCNAGAVLAGLTGAPLEHPIHLRDLDDSLW